MAAASLDRSRRLWHFRPRSPHRTTAVKRPGHPHAQGLSPRSAPRDRGERVPPAVTWEPGRRGETLRSVKADRPTQGAPAVKKQLIIALGIAALAVPSTAGAADYGAGTCLNGYVWREAFEGDN